MATIYEIMTPVLNEITEQLRINMLSIRRGDAHYRPDFHVHVVRDSLDQMNIKIYSHIDYLGAYPYVLLDEIKNVKSETDVSTFAGNIINDIENKKVEYWNKIKIHYDSVTALVNKKKDYRQNNKTELESTTETPLMQASKSLILCLDDEYERFKVKKGILQ
jgi:hypothetical protein